MSKKSPFLHLKILSEKLYDSRIVECMKYVLCVPEQMHTFLAQTEHSQQMEGSSGFDNSQSLKILSSPLKAAGRVKMGREGSPGWHPLR